MTITSKKVVYKGLEVAKSPWRGYAQNNADRAFTQMLKETSLPQERIDYSFRLIEEFLVSSLFKKLGPRNIQLVSLSLEEGWMKLMVDPESISVDKIGLEISKILSELREVFFPTTAKRSSLYIEFSSTDSPPNKTIRPIFSKLP